MPSSRRGEALLIAQTRTCRGAAPPSCYRKSVLSLKHPAGVFVASANANLSGRSPSILLAQKRSVAQTSHWDVCCQRKRELVGAQPLHLAIARPFCRLHTPLGLSLLHFVSQTRIWLFAYILNINIQLFLIVNYNYFISVF